jgi:hypothetical protein
MCFNLLTLIKNKKMEHLFASNSCVNCKNISQENKCNVHRVEVSEKYTCNDFDLTGNGLK